MFQDQDGEREILLGNKQLLGIFFVLAVLFAVFFTAGYMVGHNGIEKKPAATSTNAGSNSPAGADDSAGMGETHAVGAESGTSAGAEPLTVSDSRPSGAAVGSDEAPSRSAGGESVDTDRESSASRRKRAKEAQGVTARPELPPHAAFVPQTGQTYLQVAAVTRPEAETVAGVLSKRGFHAHVAPKPGTKWFRVLVGPVHDAGELSTTRDALMKKGFREVFVQRY
jgi:cell division septation protein DedD